MLQWYLSRLFYFYSDWLWPCCALPELEPYIFFNYVKTFVLLVLSLACLSGLAGLLLVFYRSSAVLASLLPVLPVFCLSYWSFACLAGLVLLSVDN